ncbi:MAG: hypothetical protein Kow00105_18990 [Phycisphaeraceae bacterium]
MLNCLTDLTDELSRSDWRYTDRPGSPVVQPLWAYDDDDDLDTDDFLDDDEDDFLDDDEDDFEDEDDYLDDEDDLDEDLLDDEDDDDL